MRDKDKSKEQLAKESVELRKRITEIEHVVKKLQDTNERYEALFDRSLFCVYIHDFQGNFLDANNAALNLLGYTREEVPSFNFASFLSEDQLPKVFETIEELQRTGSQRERTQYRLRRKDGSFVWVETQACLIYRHGKPYALQEIAFDVTDRKLAEEKLKRHHDDLEDLVEERTSEIRMANELLKRKIAERTQAEDKIKKLNVDLEKLVKERTQELEKAYEELKELDGMKNNFLSLVSHELRTPLTSIRSFSEILLRYEDVEPKDQKQFVKIINSESERLTRLINNFLDLSKIEAGRMVWNDGPFSLLEISNEVAAVQRPLLEEKSLRVSVNVSPELPLVFADRDRIQQVITNLLSNAINFSFEGGEITIRAEAFQGRRYDDAWEWIKVSVSDQGSGIQEKDFMIIFDKFCQGPSDTIINRHRGTGLGLSISKEIITHYGGNIWVESQEGKGSTFSFTLPAGPSACV